MQAGPLEPEVTAGCGCMEMSARGREVLRGDGACREDRPGLGLLAGADTPPARSPTLSARLWRPMGVLRTPWRTDGDQSPRSSLGSIPEDHNFFFVFYLHFIYMLATL